MFLYCLKSRRPQFFSMLSPHSLISKGTVPPSAVNGNSKGSSHSHDSPPSVFLFPLLDNRRSGSLTIGQNK